MAETAKSDLRTNLTNRGTWMRALFMVLFAIFFNIAELLVGVIVVFQFIHLLVTGRSNPRLVELGQSLGQYILEILRYLTFNTEDRPFPFADWPGAPATPKRKPAGRKPTAAKK